MSSKAQAWAIARFNKRVNSKNFWSYEDITLRLYLEIARTGKLNLLAKRKIYVPVKTLLNIWESIVRRNGEENKNSAYEYYHSLEETYGILLSDYIAIKATIAMLVIRYSQEDYDFLASKGYRLPKYDKDKPEQYSNMLMIATKRVEDLITRIKLNRREMENVENAREAVEFPTLEKLIAGLSIDLPFELKDDVKLERYNYYKRLVTERRKQKSNGGD